MQKITVLCVGKLKEAFYEQAVKEYEKRLSRCCKLELLELPEQRLGDEPSEAEIRQESVWMLKSIVRLALE